MFAIELRYRAALAPLRGPRVVFTMGTYYCVRESVGDGSGTALAVGCHMNGGIFSVILMLPNLAWLAFPARDSGAQASQSKGPSAPILEKLESASRAAIFTLPFFYAVEEPRHLIEQVAFFSTWGFAAVYYLGWARYFLGKRSLRALYAPLWGLPIPLAVLPVVYFGAVSLVLHSTWLAVAAIALGLSHVPLSYGIARRLGLCAPTDRDVSTSARAPMAGRVCVVTGANSGIGKATALELAVRGATVVLVCRDRERGARAREAVVAASGNTDVHLCVADLLLQTEVRSLAVELQSRFGQIQVLVHSAGAAFFERALTPEGVERNFALNVLAPFLLTELLLPRLKASVPSRVVMLTGAQSRDFKLQFDNLQLEKHFDAMLGAKQAGLGKVLLTEELARRLAGSGVTVNSVYPGPVRTALQLKLPRIYMPLVYPVRLFFQSPARGARGPVYLSCAPELSETSGVHFRGTQAVPGSLLPTRRDDAQRLWELASCLTATTPVSVLG